MRALIVCSAVVVALFVVEIGGAAVKAPEHEVKAAKSDVMKDLLEKTKSEKMEKAKKASMLKNLLERLEKAKGKMETKSESEDSSEDSESDSSDSEERKGTRTASKSKARATKSESEDSSEDSESDSSDSEERKGTRTASKSKASATKSESDDSSDESESDSSDSDERKSTASKSKARSMKIWAALREKVKSRASSENKPMAAKEVSEKRTVATRLTDAHKKEIAKAFSMYDGNGDGQITAKEIQAELASEGVEETLENLETAIKYMDQNGDLMISYDELYAAMAPGYEEEEKFVREMFDDIDDNHDGTISQSELGDALAFYDVSSGEADDDFKKMDTDHNGKVSFDEFIADFETGKKSSRM